MTKEELELEAEKVYPKKPFWIGSGDSARLYDEFKSQRDAFVSGATSDSAKEYWYKRFEKEKIKEVELKAQYRALSQVEEMWGAKLSKHKAYLFVIKKMKEILDQLQSIKQNE
jgi:hypothetical protein